MASQVPGIAVVGSIVLNQPMGGINPWAVEAAGRGGAKVVWMPTAHSENQLAHESAPGARPHPAAMHLPGRARGVTVFDADGNLTADTEAVLEIIRDRGMVLATGHLTPDEVDRLTARAIEIGHPQDRLDPPGPARRSRCRSSCRRSWPSAASSSSGPST